VGAGWNFGIATAFEFRLSRSDRPPSGVLTTRRHGFTTSGALSATSRPAPDALALSSASPGPARDKATRTTWSSDRVHRLEPQRLGR
jgi:hypothetical protein